MPHYSWKYCFAKRRQWYVRLFDDFWFRMGFYSALICRSHAISFDDTFFLCLLRSSLVFFFSSFICNTAIRCDVMYVFREIAYGITNKYDGSRAKPTIFIINMSRMSFDGRMCVCALCISYWIYCMTFAWDTVPYICGVGFDAQWRLMTSWVASIYFDDNTWRVGDDGIDWYERFAIC